MYIRPTSLSEILIEKAPFFRAFLSLGLGICFARVFTSTSEVIFYFIFVTILSVAFIFSFSKRLLYFQSLLVMMSIASFGSWWYTKSVRDTLDINNDRKINYQAIITSEPIEKRKVVQCDLTITSENYKGKKIRASFLKDKYTAKHRNIYLGTCLDINSDISSLNDNNLKNDKYTLWLRDKGYSGTSFITSKKYKFIATNKNNLSFFNRMKLHALIVRHNLSYHLRTTNLQDKSLSIVSAMTLGDKSRLSSETYDTFSKTGASHILALSGMHLGILVMFLRGIFRNRRMILGRNAILLFFIWVYLFIVGLPISAVRAAIMMSIVLILEMLEENYLPINSLSLAGIIIVVARPTAVFDVGFQLSFISVFFILLLSNSMENVFSIPKRRFFSMLQVLWSMTVVSFTAWLGTFPLILYHFGKFSTYSILSNFIVVPAAYIVILGTIVLLLFDLEWLQQIVAELINTVIVWLSDALQFVSSLPFAYATGKYISLFTTILIYLVISIAISLWFKWYNHKQKAAADAIILSPPFE